MNLDIDPKIENFFNYHSVKNVEDIIQVMSRDTFQYNTRIVKYILGLDSEKFEYLRSNIKKELVEGLLELAISNNYHLIEEYKKNINSLTLKELNYGY